MLTQPRWWYIHTDALGSPVAVTDASGVVIERTVYGAYGEVINRPLAGGPGYTGHVEDAETGLNYMQQRYYEPEVGRFLSVDPVTAHSNPVKQFNRYRYADSNPYRFVDPDGRAGTDFRSIGSHVRLGGASMTNVPGMGGASESNASSLINDGLRKFTNASAQSRYNAAVAVVKKVMPTVRTISRKTPDEFAKVFMKVFQPASTRLGVEFGADIVRRLEGFGTDEVEVGSKFRRIDGVGAEVGGAVTNGGYNIHIHPLEDISGLPHVPFSGGDVQFNITRNSTGYVFTPAMRLFKNSPGEGVEEVL